MSGPRDRYSPDELVTLFDRFQRDHPQAEQHLEGAFEAWLETLPTEPAGDVTLEDVVTLTGTEVGKTVTA